jgi:phospholipase/carboxylesterase
MKCKSIAVILLCFLSAGLRAQPKLQKDLPLKYLVREPAKKAAHPPVIILMHGYGSNETDLFDLKEKLPKNFLVVSVRAPLTLSGNAYQWYRKPTINEDLKSSGMTVQSFITAIVKKYHADADRVYLSGFSQGAMMSYEVGLSAPELLKGIAPLSGMIVTSMKPQGPPTDALKKLRIFVGHGDADNRIPYSQAVDAVNYLKTLGLSPEFHTYKGMQHAISDEELKDLVRWLGEK